MLASADVIRVFAPGSIGLEAVKQREFVQVAGEIKQPGIYQIASGETLRELITRLGGVTERGYLFAMRLNREAARREQQNMVMPKACLWFIRRVRSMPAVMFPH